MTKKYFETKFNVTETLQNGRERRITKSVFSELFKENKNNSTQQRISTGKKALEEAHYYDIEYVSTHTTNLIFED